MKGLHLHVLPKKNQLWIAGILLLLTSVLVMAQTETGRVGGTITDASGAVVPGATITLKSVATGTTRSTVSDEAGRYLIANLVPANYEMTIEMSGFKTTTAKILVTVGSSVAFNAKLEIAGAAETITVTAESTVINTVNSEVTATVNQQQIRELPTITRNAYALVGLVGNAAPDDTSGRGTGYSLNGMRSASTNVLLDGSANNDEFTATIGQDVPLDSVQEFSVVSNNFSAQYGRATGGIVNVATKSGSNEFHGTVYEFFRNDNLANNTVDNIANGIGKGQFTRHQTGGSIGGPVVKDKVHFFSNLEYIRVRSADTQISWVPTPEFLAASSKNTQAFFTKYGKTSINGPKLTRADVSAIFGSTAGAFNSLPASMPVFGQVQKSLPIDAGGGAPQDNYQWISRVDWSLGTNTQFYARYAYQNAEFAPGTNASSPYDGFDTGSLNKNHNVLGSLTHVFSPTITSQTKVVWNRLYGDQPLNGDPQPTLYMNPTTAIRMQGYRIAFPGYLPWSPGSAIPFGGPQQLMQLYQDQTWLKGKHDFRFGGSFVHMLDDRTFGAYANAVESLNTTSAALTSLNNFVLGEIRRFQTAINPEGYPGGKYTTPVSLPSFNSKNKYNEFALYANDDWKVKPGLTVNMGLRYEYYGPQTKSEPKYDSNFYYADPKMSVSTGTPQQIIEALRTGKTMPTNESPIKSLWKSDWNNFAPRVGFAWDVTGNGKTAIRGGYGMAYERNFGNVTYNVLFNPPKYLVASIDAPTDVSSMPIYTDPSGPFGGVAGVTKTIPGGSLRHVDQNIKTAYSHFWGFSLQRELAGKLVAKAEYSGSLGRKLYDLGDNNKVGACLAYGITTCTNASGTVVPGWTGRPNPVYTAFNTRGNRGQSEYHGMTLSLETRSFWKTGLQFTGSYTYGHAKDNLSSTFSDSAANYNLGYLDSFNPMLDWGYAEFDVRHRTVVSGIWAVPLGRNSSGFAKALIADWQFNFIFNAQSGSPFTLWDCTNGYALCMRAQDPVGIDKNATGSKATGSPNEYTLLDLAPILKYAGGYVNAKTGNSDFGPYPADMTERDAFRGPGRWNMDLGLSKRFRIGDRYAIQLRMEAYNVFNHANMYVEAASADISSVTQITGSKDGNRRMQIAAKWEF